MKSELSPPGKLQTLLEVRTPFQVALLLFKACLFKNMSLANAPKGDGRAIVLLPGYLTDKYSMYPLKSYLSFLGYKVYDWGQGRNKGEVELLVEKEIQHIQQLKSDESLDSVTLIGWSLGGVISREIARLLPETVAEVITMGTPVTGGPKYTAPCKQYIKSHGINIDELEQRILEHNQMGLSQPVTSIYSKTDGVVAWEASLDIYNEHARNIEVSSTHMAMGLNAQVWMTLAQVLAESKALSPIQKC